MQKGFGKSRSLSPIIYANSRKTPRLPAVCCRSVAPAQAIRFLRQCCTLLNTPNAFAAQKICQEQNALGSKNLLLLPYPLDRQRFTLPQPVSFLAFYCFSCCSIRMSATQSCSWRTLYLMDAGLFIDPLAVCIDGAGGAARPAPRIGGCSDR